MTISKQERLENRDLALQLMMAELGDRAIDTVDFDVTQSPFFERIRYTTWEILEEEGAVKTLDAIGHTHRYLTGLGC
jgi:hypothetical protein